MGEFRSGIMTGIPVGLIIATVILICIAIGQIKKNNARIVEVETMLLMALHENVELENDKQALEVMVLIRELDIKLLMED